MMILLVNSPLPGDQQQMMLSPRHNFYQTRARKNDAAHRCQHAAITAIAAAVSITATFTADTTAAAHDSAAAPGRAAVVRRVGIVGQRYIRVRADPSAALARAAARKRGNF